MKLFAITNFQETMTKQIQNSNLQIAKPKFEILDLVFDVYLVIVSWLSVITGAWSWVITGTGLLEMMPGGPA
mgnify:CR=1 FL=1